MFEPASKWLSNIWIIEKDSGICIFEQSFKNINMNPDLISGFLIAMLNFGKELADKDFESIQFKELKIALNNYDHYIIAMAITDDANDADVRDFFEIVSDEFSKRYDEILTDWQGETSIFDKFGEYTENLVDRPAIKAELVKKKIVKKIEDSAEESEFVRESLVKLDKVIDISKREWDRIKEDGVRTEIEKRTDEAIKFAKGTITKWFGRNKN